MPLGCIWLSFQRRHLTDNLPFIHFHFRLCVGLLDEVADESICLSLWRWRGLPRSRGINQPKFCVLRYCSLSDPPYLKLIWWRLPDANNWRTRPRSYASLEISMSACVILIQWSFIFLSRFGSAVENDEEDVFIVLTSDSTFNPETILFTRLWRISGISSTTSIFLLRASSDPDRNFRQLVAECNHQRLRDTEDKNIRKLLVRWRVSVWKTC